MPNVESFDGTTIHYEISGEGTPLILLPSCGTTTGIWKYQDPLANKYKLIKIDIAGVGNHRVEDGAGARSRGVGQCAVDPGTGPGCYWGD